MRKRLIRTVVFIAVAFGVAFGAAEAAGAVDLGHPSVSTNGVIWE